jgi:hypothetical protein
MKWRIYYADGTTFDNTQGEAWEAPALGVQVIWQLVPEDILIHGSGSAGHSELGWFSYRHDWGWDIHDMIGLINYFITYKRPQAVLMGSTIPTDKFQEILKQAIKDKTDG